MMGVTKNIYAVKKYMGRKILYLEIFRLERKIMAYT